MSFPTVDAIYPYGVGGCVGMVYLDPYLYALFYGAASSPRPKLHKINPDTYAKISEWTAPSPARYGGSLYTDCEYLYAGTSSEGSVGNHHPIRVYKINPETMATVKSWAGQATGDVWAKGIRFDFQSERLLVLEDRQPYRIYKLKQDLTLEMQKDATEYPPSQYHAGGLTIQGDYFYVAATGNPATITKRKISDLSLVDYFEGTTDNPDEYVEGIFRRVTNDGQYLYVATYDYAEYRPTRLIKINPSDMSRVGTYYGASDELYAHGCYYYGGKVYMLLTGWDGGSEYGEQVLQIDPSTLTRTARYANWTGDYNGAYRAVGDGSRLHVGFWGSLSRRILQFAEPGAELCAPTHGIVSLGDKVLLCPIGNRHGNIIALKSGQAAVTDKTLIAALNNQIAQKLDFRSGESKVGDKVICTPINRAINNVLGLR